MQTAGFLARVWKGVADQLVAGACSCSPDSVEGHGQKAPLTLSLAVAYDQQELARYLPLGADHSALEATGHGTAIRPATREWSHESRARLEPLDSGDRTTASVHRVYCPDAAPGMIRRQTPS